MRFFIREFCCNFVGWVIVPAKFEAAGELQRDADGDERESVLPTMRHFRRHPNQDRRDLRRVQKTLVINPLKP